MRKARYFSLFSLLLLANAQWSSSALANTVPYREGEKTSFSITYFGATAGILDLEVLSSEMGEAGKKTANFVDLAAKARTDSIFSLFYYLENIYRSTVNSGTGLPVRFVITHDETKFGGTVTQEFDPTKKKVTHRDRRTDRKGGKKIEKDFVKDIPAATQDVVSVFFHVRGLPLAVGKKFEVPVFIGEENCLLRLEVVEEDTIFTKIGEVPAFVIRPSLLKEGRETEIPETYLWIAKDKNRAIVKIKAKVKIGSVVAYLRSYSPGKSGEPVKNTSK